MGKEQGGSRHSLPYRACPLMGLIRLAKISYHSLWLLTHNTHISLLITLHHVNIQSKGHFLDKKKVSKISVQFSILYFRVRAAAPSIDCLILKVRTKWCNWQFHQYVSLIWFHFLIHRIPSRWEVWRVNGSPSYPIRWEEWRATSFFFVTAVYLCKRTMQNKTRLELTDYEAENLARLQKMFSRKWEFIFMQAEAQSK